MDRKMEGQRRKDGQTDGRTVGRMDRKMEGQSRKDGQKDGRTE